MGLCDIYSHWKEYGYEKPVIKETINPDRTTLTLNMKEIVTVMREIVAVKPEAFGLF